MKRALIFAAALLGAGHLSGLPPALAEETGTHRVAAVPNEKYETFTVPPEGAQLTLTLIPSGDDKITSSGILYQDGSDTMAVWVPVETLPCQNHVYQTFRPSSSVPGIKHSSREWLTILGTLGQCGSGGPGTDQAQIFWVDVPAADIDIEGVAEEQEESIGGLICVGTTCVKKVTINPVQAASRHSGTVTLTGVGIAPTAGAKVKLWADAARTTSITLPKIYTTPSGLPQDLWAEGIVASDAQGDVELTVSYTTPDGKITEDKVKLSVIPSEFDIQVTAFIPEDHIEPFFTIYGGDGAIPLPPSLVGFTRARTSFRLRQSITVIPDQTLSTSGEKPGSKLSPVGQTRSYDQATALAGTPPMLTAAAKADTVTGVPLMIDFATATPTVNNNTVTRLNAKKVKVSFRMGASNPLVTGSPDIDWEVEINIDVTNPLAPGYTAVGDHDGYPAYDIFINGTRIHHYDPRSTGEGVGSLGTPMEKHFDNSGTLP